MDNQYPMQGYREQKIKDSRPGSHPTESQNVMNFTTLPDYFAGLTMRLITSEVVLPPLCMAATIAVTSMVMLSFFFKFESSVIAQLST